MQSLTQALMDSRDTSPRQQSMRKLVQANPVVPSRIDETLEPKLHWLQERLPLDDKSLNKLLVQRPLAVL